MRLLLMADGSVGLRIVQYLLAEYASDIVMIVSPSREIENLAHAGQVAFHRYTSEEDLIAALPADIDLGVLAWWPYILRDQLIEKPVLGFVNTHPSMLPWNRGKHPNFWALVEQVPFGVTLHQVESGIDTGKIVAQRLIPYDWMDTGESLYLKAQAEMETLFKDMWPVLRAGSVQAVDQAADAGSFHLSTEIHMASRLDLDASMKTRDLLNLLRARTFPPHPACWFEEDGDKYEVSIKIKKVVS